MRIPSHRERSALRFNITPLIDVVFLLIIFFLVASHIARTQAQETVDLPDAVKVEEDTPAVALLTITVAADGALSVGGKPIAKPELAIQLQALRDSSSPPEVRIRGSRLCEFRHIEPILLECARTGINNVKFAVRKAGSQP